MNKAGSQAEDPLMLTGKKMKISQTSEGDRASLFHHAAGAMFLSLCVPFLAHGTPADSGAVSQAIDSSRAPQLLGELVVQAEKIPTAKGEKMRVDSVSTGTLGKERLQDVPRSVFVSTDKFIKDQQAQYVQDVLRTDPNVTHLTGSNTTAGGSSFSLRGFKDGTVDLVDGLTANSRVPVEDKESIEVISGPASFLYGMNKPGGSINYVLKRPTDTTFVSATVGDYGGEQGYMQGDVGGPLLGGKYGYRINALYVDRGETGVKDQTHERNLLSGVLDINTIPNTKISLDASHYYVDVEHGDNNFSLGSKVTKVPDAPDASTNYMPSYSSAPTLVNRVGATLSTEITPFLKLRSNLRWLDKESRRLTGTAKIINNDGDFTMSRNNYDQDEIFLQGNTYLEADFKTFGISHTATVGVLGIHRTSRFAYPYACYSTGYKVSYSGTNNLYDLQPWPSDSGNIVASHNPDVTNERNWTTDALLSDKMDIGSHWSLDLGMAWMHIDDQQWYLYEDASEIRQPTYKKDAFTPMASLSFKPISALSTYVSYAEGLREGPTAPDNANNAGETLAPYRTRQVEGGIKGHVYKLDLATALFWATTANAYTDAGTNEYVEDGRQVSKGVEVTAAGGIGPYLTLGGGFTVLTAEVTEAAADSLEGKTPVSVPKRVAKLYSELAIPFFPRLFVSGDVSYTDEVYVDNMNNVSIPKVIVGDAGLRYVQPLQSHELVFRAHVTNITDKDYWISNGTTLSLGNPRTFAGSVTFTL